MIQINDDYYEDLTPESIVVLLKALRASAEQMGAAGGAAGLTGSSTDGMGSSEADNIPSAKKYVAGSVKVPASVRTHFPTSPVRARN